MKRGDVVTMAMQGDFGKPRPALVIQSDAFNDTHATISVLLISSEHVNAPLFRIDVAPDQENRLNTPCQIRVDKPMTIRREKIGAALGKLDDATMLRVSRALTVWIGLGLRAWLERLV